MKLSVWDKNKHLGSNARNFCAGILHKKTKNNKHLNLLEFIGFEYISHSNLSMSDQLDIIKEYGFDVPEFILIKNS